MSAKTCPGARMTAALGVVLATFVTCAAGCSAGADIYVEPTKNEPAASGLCGLGAEENICARSFDLGIALDRQARFIGFLEAITAVARIARDGREDVTHACEGILDGLGAPRPTLAANASSQDIARVLCTAAEAAVRAEPERGAFTLASSPAACTTFAPPACASDKRPRTACARDGVTIAMHDGASARAVIFGTTLGKVAAPLLYVRSRLTLSAELFSRTGDADGVAGGGDSALARSCRTEALSLGATATNDLQLAVDLSTSLLAAIEPGR